MKLPLIAITILLSSTSASALDLASAHAHWNAQKVFHKSCELLTSKAKDNDAKLSQEKFHKILSEKGYKIKFAEDEFKPVKSYSIFSGSRGRERKRLEHAIKQCEKAKSFLSLDFDSGWKTPYVGFNVVKITQYKQDFDCDASKGVINESDRIVLREHRKEYDKQKDTRPDYTEQQSVEALHHDTFFQNIVALPNCEKSDAVVTMDPNSQIDMLAPPPAAAAAEELSIDDRERLRTKELNEREFQRTKPANVNAGQAR